MAKTAKAMKIKIFGYSIPIAVVAMLGLVGTASALLSVYATLSGSANVSQSIVLDTSDDTGGCHLTWADQSVDQCTQETSSSASFSADVTGGETRDVGLRILNQAGVSAEFGLVSTSDDPELFGSDVAVSYQDDYDPETETCTGNVIEDPANVPINGSTSQWFCARYVWDIASSPASYGITLEVVPS